MMWWHGDWNGWAWLAMSASMLVFWGLVIWGVVTVARSANQPARHTLDTPPRDPEQILRERFAQGDIDETEYEHRRQVLRR
ncbi:MAG: SHOCT domain-containing protein [Acidimicrobiales bacterium]|nr:SHOCT domain-containing protein [Acidimicrobiales bacterium]